MLHCKVREVRSALQNEDLNLVHFVDVRTDVEFKEEHIKGFENIPLDKVEKYADQFCKYEKVYVTCKSGGRSMKAIEKLGEIDTELVNVDGGLLQWKAEGLPLESGGGGLPIIRQVLIAAGCLVLIGVALALFWNWYAIWLSAFVGVGLVFAGVTGWCGMAKILGVMPWNK